MPKIGKTSEPKKDPMGLAEPWNDSGESPRGISLASFVGTINYLCIYTDSTYPLMYIYCKQIPLMFHIISSPLYMCTFYGGTTWIRKSEAAKVSSLRPPPDGTFSLFFPLSLFCFCIFCICFAVWLAALLCSSTSAL